MYKYIWYCYLCIFFYRFYIKGIKMTEDVEAQTAPIAEEEKVTVVIALR